MKTKNILAVGLVAALAVGIAGLSVGNRKAGITVASGQTSPSPQIHAAEASAEPAATPETPVVTLDHSTPSVQLQPTAKPGGAQVPPVVKTNQPVMQNSRPPGGKPPIQDPDARESLRYVGADPEAEGYWASAINDPTLPAEERKDLIEDLNEDGLSNPDHPGPQDLDLILSRIALIEEMEPYAMDEVNADAFEEAHKDLVNLANGYH